MVDLKQVTVSYRSRTVLDRLTLHVDRGRSLALWGHNGAGKTTAFHALLDLVPYTGRIQIAGRDAHKEGAAVRRLIGWSPQDMPRSELTVGATLGFTADLRETRISSASEYLRPFGLETSTGLTVAALSGGQRKRLAVALALVGDPELLLLDEPTANLDPDARQEVIRLLLDLKRQGKTMIIASHRRSDVMQLADQVAILKDGCLTGLRPAAGMVRLQPPSRFRRGDRACAGE